MTALKEGAGFIITGGILTVFLALFVTTALYEKIFGIGPCDHLKD